MATNPVLNAIASKHNKTASQVRAHVTSVCLSVCLSLSSLLVCMFIMVPMVVIQQFDTETWLKYNAYLTVLL